MARPPETKDLIRVVQAMTEKYDRVYLAIDGLDECGSNVVEALQALKKVAKCRQVSAAFFSRNEPDIMEELGHTQRIEIAAHTEDLELYVLAQMEARKKLGNLAVRSPELHEHIRRTLVGGANGMSVVPKGGLGVSCAKYANTFKPGFAGLLANWTTSTRFQAMADVGRH